jgi:pimeloyl-ACP methyl ester carboxylesterase
MAHESMPSLSGVRHDYVNAGGLRTHVALAGPEDAAPVMLVHGWPQNWWAWRHVIPALSSSFRVIAPDLRGHGWTEAPAGGYEKEQLASDLLALLDALGIERAMWVGHDWGAWTGYLAALRAPERLERLLALCIPHPWTPPHPRQLALLGYQGPISAPVLGRFAAGPMARSILQTGRAGDRLSPRDVALFVEQLPSRVTVAMYRTFLTREVMLLARGRYADARLVVPTTQLVGARDPVTSSSSPGSVNGQPQLNVEVLEGVGHWVPEQRPDSICDWIDPSCVGGSRSAPRHAEPLS